MRVCGSRKKKRGSERDVETERKSVSQPAIPLNPTVCVQYGAVLDGKTHTNSLSSPSLIHTRSSLS